MTARAGLQTVRHSETSCTRTQRNGRQGSERTAEQTEENGSGRSGAASVTRSPDHVGVRIPASQPSSTPGPALTQPQDSQGLRRCEHPFSDEKALLSARSDSQVVLLNRFPSARPGSGQVTFSSPFRPEGGPHYRVVIECSTFDRALQPRGTGWLNTSRPLPLSDLVCHDRCSRR
jgi:hypothetical protein